MAARPIRKDGPFCLRLSSLEVTGDEVAGLADYFFVAAEAGEPAEGGVFAEPGELAFGIVAMTLLGQFYGFVEGELVAQDGDGLGVAEGGEGADGIYILRAAIAFD